MCWAGVQFIHTLESVPVSVEILFIIGWLRGLHVTLWLLQNHLGAFSFHLFSMLKLGRVVFIWDPFVVSLNGLSPQFGSSSSPCLQLSGLLVLLGDAHRLRHGVLGLHR